MSTKLNNIINSAAELMSQGNYAGARVFYRCAIAQAVKDDLLELANELRIKLENAENASKLEIDRMLVEQNEADTRRAYCVNKVNYNHMRLAKRVSEFLTVNPPENKVDGTFTKKYAEKIANFKIELSGLIDGPEIEFDLFRYTHNLTMLELTVKCRWLNIKGQRVEYKANERIRADDSNLLVLATDRTAEFYSQCRAELKECELKERELASRISTLKSICQE